MAGCKGLFFCLMGLVIVVNASGCIDTILKDELFIRIAD
jgi:hypothetical protein